MTASVRSALARMVPTMSPADFVTEHWGRRGGRFSGPRERFDEVYDLQHWHALRYVRAMDAATRDEDGQQRQVHIEPGQMSTLFAAGMTICADVSPEPHLQTFLAALVAELRLATIEAPFAKLYASPDGAGFALHMDAHHVFVLQLQGEKTWWHGPTPALPWTMHNAKVDRNGRAVMTGPHDGEPLVTDDGQPLGPPSLDAMIECTLVPGDCLYLPPGTWHATRARGSSVALSVSPPRAPGHRFVLDALEASLSSAESWRRDLVGLPPDDDDPGAVPAVVRDALTRHLRELGRTATRLDIRDLQRVWCLQSSQRPFVVAAPDEPSDAELSSDDHLRLAEGGFSYMVAPVPETGDEAVLLYRDGVEWTLPVEAHDFVRTLARTPTLVAKDVLAWDPRLDWPAAAEVLAQLLQAGILTRDR